jgi:hypothetical protein
MQYNKMPIGYGIVQSDIMKMKDLSIDLENEKRGQEYDKFLCSAGPLFFGLLILFTIIITLLFY